MINLSFARLKEALDKFEADFKANGFDMSEMPVQLVSYVKVVGSDGQETRITHTQNAQEVKYSIGYDGIKLIIC